MTFEQKCAIIFKALLQPHFCSEATFSIQNGVSEFGDGLVHLVHRGAIYDKGVMANVEFKKLFEILKKYMADGYDVPQFFRELMALITTVSEEEWGTNKDPSAKLSDNTIRSYTKRGLPKKLAGTIVYRLTPENLTERINELRQTTRELMASDLQGYDADINSDNTGEKVSGIFVQIIHKAAGLVEQTALAQQKQQKIAFDLKNRYGDYLLNETNGYCAFPGCGKKLSVVANGKIAHAYEIVLIDKSKASTIDNLLAVCPQCQATYTLDENNKKLMKELKGIKSVLSDHQQSVDMLENLNLDKGITNVIKKAAKLGEKDLKDASLDPKEIKQKLSPTEDAALYYTVNGYVTVYFRKIKEIMTNLDKRGEIDYEEVQNQIHAIYLRLKKKKKSRIEIFNEIADKIHRVTLQDDIYCKIVVSYFVQSCEVFDAIT